MLVAEANWNFKYSDRVIRADFFLDRVHGTADQEDFAVTKEVLLWF